MTLAVEPSANLGARSGEIPDHKEEDGRERGEEATRRRGRARAGERACVFVDFTQITNTIHFPEGLFRPGSQNDAGNSKSFLVNAACTCTSCSRRDPISSDDDGRPPSRQKFKVKASKLWHSRVEERGKGGKGKEAEFMNRCMDQRRRGRKEEERGRRRHKKHKKDFIGPSARPTASVCRFPTGLMRRDNVKRHPARSL